MIKYLKMLRKLTLLGLLVLVSVDPLLAQVTKDVKTDSVRTVKASTNRSRIVVDTNARRGLFNKGITLGADRDTLQYVVASPFDNWFVSIGGGIQTFIGNEIEARARRNGMNFQIYGELGKWLIPDVSVSVHAKLFDVTGQSRYGKQPFIDFTDANVVDGYYDYQKFHAYGASLGFLVTMDWVNFLNGYEVGQQKRLHFMTPVGLGMSMLFGTQKNPRGNYPVGTFRENMELYYMGSLLFEYYASRHLALDFAATLFGSESTWDWSPYDNSYTIFDVMPQLTFGARFNIFREVHIVDWENRLVSQRINHVFLPANMERVEIMRSRIDSLNYAIDQLEDQGDADAAKIDDLTRQRDSLIAQVGNLEQEKYRANDLLSKQQQLLDLADFYGLPSAIVYFQLDRYNIDYNARKTLQNFAAKIKNLPDTCKYYIIGAADSATGTPAHNQVLSEHRCQSIYNMLTMTFGVDPNRLEMKALGGIYEYDPEEMNRVGIIVLRNDELTKLIDKWQKKK